MNSDYPASELTLIIERFLLLRQQGMTMTVAQLCKDTPHLADAVQSELLALEKMDSVLNSALDESGESRVGNLNSKSDQPGLKIGKRQGMTDSATHFQIERLIAYGGCSEVYVATDQTLNRPVAIKFLRPDTEHLATYRKRLQREAEITGQLSHPGVVSIHSMGTDSKGLPFYCMRLIEGESLAETIEQFHKVNASPKNRAHPILTLEGRKLLNHFRDTCQTIAFAHSKSVLHRDIKPANIVIGSFGETYVIDWGLARRSGNEQIDEIESEDAMSSINSDETNASPRLTRHGSALGSPAFMSPEQALGQSVGTSSDIFNLGATLYAILTGSPPYSNESLIRTMEQAGRASFVSARECNRLVPPELDAICLKAMHRRPDNRYQSADQLADDIDRYLADQAVTAMPEPILEKIRRWVKQRKTLVTTVATSAILGIVLLTIGNAVLFDRNRKLAQREAEAVFLKGETQTALEIANSSLYSQRISLAHAEWLKNNPQRALQILMECPVSLRQWEWHHLRWLVTRHAPYRTAEGNGSTVYGLDFNRLTGGIVFGDNVGRVHLWNPEADGRSHFETGIEIKAIALDAKCKLLAVAGNKPDSNRAVIQVWNLADGQLKKERSSKSTGSFISVSWSDDIAGASLLVTGASSGGIRVRDPETLKPVLRIQGHSGGVGCVAFLPGSDQVISCGADGTFKKWNAEGDKESERLLHPSGLTSFVIGKQIVGTCGNDKLVRLWGMNDKNEFGPHQQDSIPERAGNVLVGHTDHIQTIAISADEKYLATAGLDRTIRIWDIERREEVAVVRQHSSHIRKIGFDPAGRYLVSCGDDNRVNVWEVNSLIRPIPKGRLVGFSHDAKQLLVAGSESISMWEANDLSPELRITDQPETLICLATNPQQPVVAGTYRRGEVVIWHTRSGKRLHTFDRNTAAVYAAEFSPDGKQLFVGHDDGSLLCYSMKTGKILVETKTDDVIYRMALTRDGGQLVVGHRSGKLRFFSSAGLVENFVAQATDSVLLDLASNPIRNEIATADQKGRIRLWDPATGTERLKIEVGASWLNCLEYTPDGKRLVSGSEHTVTFWDSQTGNEVLSLSLDRCVHSMAFSRDGKILAVAGEDPRVRIWRADSFGQVSLE